jgi:arylformamidase
MNHKTDGISNKVNRPNSDWIDISVPLCDSLRQSPYELLTPHIERIRSREKGDKVVLTQLFINAHSGTHIDAPFEWIEGGQTIDEMSLDTTVGPARVIEIQDSVSIKVEELKPYKIRPGERLLFKTRNSSRSDLTKIFHKDNVYVSDEAAQFLAEKRVRVVGLDSISIGSFQDGKNIAVTHQTLLGKGIYIIEDIDLSNVKPGSYELICVPIRLEKGDAGLARAIIRPL